MKKDSKKTIKTTKKAVKEFKPTFVVDLSGIDNIQEAYAAYGLAKQNAGLAMSDVEFDAIVSVAVEAAVNATAAYIDTVSTKVKIEDGEKVVFDSNGNMSVKKPNIFKRFWNWLKYSFTW